MAQIITVFLLLSGWLSAQQTNPTNTFYESFLRKLAFHEMEIRRSDIEREMALRRQARYLETQFIAKMNKFAGLWSALVRDYDEKKVFNVKLAAEVTKTFHDIESSEGWIKPASKTKR